MVPEARIELARKYKFRGILNPLCLPISPLGLSGAGNEARTRDPNLGKVMLYQLSYFRKNNWWRKWDSNSHDITVTTPSK